MRIHHIGYLVKDIEAAQRSFFALGYSYSSSSEPRVVEDLLRGIRIVFVEKDGYCVELISPIDKSSEFWPLLKKFKNTSYHICYESDCLKKDVDNLLSNGWALISDFLEAPAIFNKQVAFFFTPAIGMIEVIDNSSLGDF